MERSVESNPIFLCILSSFRHRLWLLLLLTPAAELPAQTSVPAAHVIVERMEQARSKNQASIRPYTVTRNYTLFGKDGENAKAEVLADVSFVPPGRKDFMIRRTSGSGLAERVVRRMLAGEVEIARENNSEISADNYNFQLLGQESVSGQQCYILELYPKRNDPHLLRGKAWVDAQSYQLLRTEGEPAQKPSWWVHRVSFSLTFGDVGGMWLVTGLEATADVRIMGQFRIVSRDVGYSVDEIASVPAWRSNAPAKK